MKSFFAILVGSALALGLAQAQADSHGPNEYLWSCRGESISVSIFKHKRTEVISAMISESGASGIPGAWLGDYDALKVSTSDQGLIFKGKGFKLVVRIDERVNHRFIPASVTAVLDDGTRVQNSNLLCKDP